MDATVIKVLEQAGSQDPNVLKPAEQILKQWECQKGFYTALFNIFSNQSLPVNVRWIAILYFKNGVDRYWRKNAPGEITTDEKEFLRQVLVTKFDEPINQLAIQLAVIIAKIARYDFPKEWESLISTLVDVINGNNALAQNRALLTLHHVIKVLASKRLTADRRVFQELASNLINFILNIWNTYTDNFIILTSNGAANHEIQETLDKALLSLRILGKLIVNGLNKPSENQSVMVFLKDIFERTRNSLDYRRMLSMRDIQLEVCDKFIIHLTKVLLGVLENHPLCYIDLIPASLEFTVFYCFTDAGKSLVFERFIIQCFNLLKKILQSNDYKLSAAKAVEDAKYPLRLRACQLRQEFFTPEILTEICIRLVTHYFILTPADLELWETDPENFGVDDCGESWKYSIRPCTESVFLAILHHFKDTLSNVLVELIKRHHQPINPNDLHGILVKDAVYNAVGLAGFDLYDEVNFDQWFSTTLKQELNERSDNYRIIRRRICWLIGRWTGIKLSAELRPELYSLMIQALNPEEDLGVRLAASDALKLAIDDFQFNTEDFVPFLSSVFSSLFILLKEVQECDTKMRILYVLSFMIERIGNGMKPHVAPLNTYLPELWYQSEHHNMLRCAIVSTLVQLEKALGSDSTVLQPLVVGVIDLSCDMNQDGYVYLSEDGLELWIALLENTSSSTPAIMNLLKNMPSLLESSTENLRFCFCIVEAYVLLSPEEFFTERGAQVFKSLKSILGDLRSEGIIMAMRLTELCLRAAPNRTEILKPLLLKVFESVYTGGEYATGMVLTMYLSIMARVLLNSHDVFLQVTKDLTEQLGQEYNVDGVLTKLISTYLNHMPLVTQQKKRKLLALALCSLLSSNSTPIILQYFPQIILNIVETLNDITKINDAGCHIDLLIVENYQCPSQFEDCGYETEHSKRERKLVLNDPVHYIALDGLLQDQLNTLRISVGAVQFHQMMNSFSSELSQQIREYITI